jgi:hypothetical protein
MGIVGGHYGKFSRLVGNLNTGISRHGGSSKLSSWTQRRKRPQTDREVTTSLRYGRNVTGDFPDALCDVCGSTQGAAASGTRQGAIESFDDYWVPIEAGTGQMPQAYLALPESSRRVVREEVQVRLAEFESGGRLVMDVGMLIGAGRA